METEITPCSSERDQRDTYIGTYTGRLKVYRVCEENYMFIIVTTLAFTEKKFSSIWLNTGKVKHAGHWTPTSPQRTPLTRPRSPACPKGKR